MDPSTDHEAVVSAVKETVCADPAVVFAVGFGSRFSEESTQSSDFDIAVKFADELSRRERFEKWCFLSGAVQQDKGPFIDISDIDSLPVPVAQDAVSGEFLCGSEEVFEQFKSDTEAEFTEQRERRHQEQRAVIERIAEDGLRG